MSMSFTRDLHSLHTHLNSVTLMIQPEIQPRDKYHLPEFLCPPIRCSLTAPDNDLGVFIPLA